MKLIAIDNKQFVQYFNPEKIVSIMKKEDLYTINLEDGNWLSVDKSTLDKILKQIKEWGD